METKHFMLGSLEERYTPRFSAMICSFFPRELTLGAWLLRFRLFEVIRLEFFDFGGDLT
jgi:hypothetical protein